MALLEEDIAKAVMRVGQIWVEPNRYAVLRERSILVGMRQERADPKTEIEGRQALFVVNLEPRKMAGEISEGMLFDIGYSDGVAPVLAVPERPVPNGSRGGEMTH